jgi:hypothetical protein
MPRLCSSLLTSVLISGLTGFAANATLSELDDPIFGPASLTRDTDQNLDWLDLPISAGRSYDDVSIQFGAGGDFEGFRHATRDEVQALLNGAGFTYWSCCPAIPENYQPAVFLQGLLGETGEYQQGSSYVFTVGVTGSEFIPGRHFGTAIYRDDERQVASAEGYEIRMYDDEIGPFGHWLVRPIPEPSTGLLVTIGLLGLAGSRRCRGH